MDGNGRVGDTQGQSLEVIYELGISHNKFAIPLPDGTPYPEYSRDWTGLRAREFLTHFNRVRDRDWSDCSFLDLGCSEGSTTHEISQMGSTVYGVEGREDGVRRANVIKSILGFDRTHFSVGNVDNADSYREVDGIFNAGVLYHLEDPVTCLVRCAESARQFIYLDTGHAPRSETELQNSKFAPKFGRAYKLNYDGLDLEAIDFEEPKNTAEKQQDGIRRGPRSGIGNSNSVWLSHQSTVALMAKLGFPYHEVIRDFPRFPRLRTAFFRTEPRPLEPTLDFLKPLPALLAPDEAYRRVRERDTAHIKSTGKPVLLLGREPLISAVRADLMDAEIAIGEEIVLPEEGVVSKGHLNQMTKGRGGFIVVAAPDVVPLVRNIIILDRFEYAFASFSLVREPEGIPSMRLAS